MQSLELYRILAHRIRVGLVIWPVLCFVSIVSGVLATLTSTSRPWAVTAFVVSILFYWSWCHVRKRSITALRIAENPQLVYWAYPFNGPQPFASVDSRERSDVPTCVQLHLRDGTDLDIRLPKAQMQAVLSELLVRNASVRLGAYDNGDSIATNKYDMNQEVAVVAHMLTNVRIARDLVISSLLWYTSLLVLVFSFAAGLPGTVPAVLVAIFFHIWAMMVRESYNQAVKVAANPHLIYWGHPSSRYGDLSGQYLDDAVGDCTILLLHLRDSTRFKVELPAARMRTFIEWLKGKSPLIRWGNYDSIR